MVRGMLPMPCLVENVYTQIDGNDKDDRECYFGVSMACCRGLTNYGNGDAVLPFMIHGDKNFPVAFLFFVPLHEFIWVLCLHKL